MKLLRPEDFRTTAWKNGGGITHVIAHAEEDGRTLWRLSIAEVASDGAFSVFEGLTRILTVIDGEGLDLRTPDGVLPARPLNPVRFHGECPVDARLAGGPVRDVNVMFDASRAAATVEILTGPVRTAIDGSETAMCLALRGDVAVDGAAVPSGSAALGQRLGAELAPGGLALAVRIDRIADSNGRDAGN